MRRGRRAALGGALALAMPLTACASTGSGVTAVESNLAVRGIDDGTEIDADGDVRIFTLDNGLTVYLRENDRPGGYAEMRLAVDAGSADEEHDQSAVAHFLEHMLFNGTEEFPGNELIGVLRGFGMEFGADVNAYTSYDETVYELSVPLDVPDNFDTGLTILREWLTAATIDPAEVVAERGVVLDEWRQRGQNLDGRTFVAAERLFLGDSGYAGRTPIGERAAIESMTDEPLRRFYERWYRPSNAAVVIVGDIDLDDTEESVRDVFGGLDDEAADERVPVALGPYSDPAALVHLDPDATNVSVEATFPAVAGAAATAGAHREEVLLSLAFDMIATRLQDDVRRGTAPFDAAFVSNNGYVRRLDAPSVYVSGPAAELQGAIDAVLTEVERAARFGFASGELARAVGRFESAVEAAYDGRKTVQDVEYAARYVDNFLSGSSIPSARHLFELDTDILASVTAADVSAVFARRLAVAAVHLMVVAPDDLDDPPTETSLLDAIAAASDQEIEPRPDDAGPIDGLMPVPEPVAESDRSESPFAGPFLSPTTLTFPNGATVVLNRTDIVDDYVVVSAYSPGGLSLLPPELVVAAGLASGVVAGSGLGDLDAVQVDTVLSGTAVSMSPYIDLYEEGIYGYSTPADLETAFQLLHLFISAPRFEQAALDTEIRSIEAIVDDPYSDADLAAYVTYLAARYGDVPMFQALPTLEQLAAVDVAAVEAAWRDRFASASDWVFVLSGDFDVDDAVHLARAYIGSLAGDGTREVPVEQAPAHPSSARHDVAAGSGDVAKIAVHFEGPFEGAPADSVLADVLSNLLTTRLTDHIREELGASYSPFSVMWIGDGPEPVVRTYIEIGGDPEDIAELATVLWDDIGLLLGGDLTAAEVRIAVTQVTEDYNLYSNEQLTEVLTGESNAVPGVDALVERLGFLTEEVDVDAVLAFARRVLVTDQHIEIRVLPR